MRRLHVLAAVVAIASCSTGESTSTDTLTPTTTTSTTSTTLPATAPTTPATPTPTAADSTTTAAPPATAASIPLAPTTDVAAAFAGGAEGDFWLPLGYWDGSAWVQVGQESATTPLEFPAATGDPIRLTGLDVAPTATALGDSGEACFDGRIGFGVDAAVPAPQPAGFGYSAIGVVGDWEIQPRPARQAGSEIDEYRQIGATFADGLGADGTAGEVVQVVRVDLDGDGMEEVLVVFEHVEDTRTPGEYTVVYLRVPRIDGSVDDTVVFTASVGAVGTDAIPVLSRARVLGVADLNGDGRMEVALHTWYYEGAAVSVYELGAGGLTQVMTNGCGA